MMKRLINLLLIIILFAGCATGKLKYRIWYDLDPSTPSPQEKNEITVHVAYVRQDKDPNWRYVVERRSGPILFPTIERMTGFWVVIQNNTDHILRMADSRVYLVIGGNTIKSLTKAELISWHAGGAEWDYEQCLPVIKQMELIDLATEVLPGFTKKGFIIFPVNPELVRTADLRFFDLVSKVDKAGNPIEKTNFTFKLIQHTEEIQPPKPKPSSESEEEWE